MAEIKDARESMSERLLSLRMKAGLSQKQVATAIGISPSTYREWEQGRSISGEPYVQMAELYGITLTELMYGEVGEKNALISELEMLKGSINRIITKLISLE